MDDKKSTKLLYYGDNLEILRDYIKDESIDLIYLDPPFNSKADYNVLFKEQTGDYSASQIHAFTDFWKWNMEVQTTYEFLLNSINTSPKIAEAVKSLVDFVGKNDLSAYLVMMCIRLIELRKKLKDSGSLYLHCDPGASHYLKVLLDVIFGIKNFKNEIVWQRTFSHNDPRKYGNIADIILFYTKSEKYTWNKVYKDYTESYIKNFFKYEDENGRYRLVILTGMGISKGHSGMEWKGYDPGSIGRHWSPPIRVRKKLGIGNDVGIIQTLDKMEKAGRIVWSRNGVPSIKQYIDEIEGTPLQNIWTDIPPISSQSDERTGFQTQKPLELLERIIRSSSNEGDLVLDPFCGCGTAVISAEKLGRNWIGIDVTHLAINLVKDRLRTAFKIKAEVIGEPKDIAGATALSLQDRFQFEWWALSLIGARPENDQKKKGADKGIDGIILNPVSGTNKVFKGIVQVKSGHVNVSQIRDLNGTMLREKADYGIFITLEEPTQNMKDEAIKAGNIKDNFGTPIPKIRIVTIAELLKGLKLDYPSEIRNFKVGRKETKEAKSGVNTTFSDFDEEFE